MDEYPRINIEERECGANSEKTDSTTEFQSTEVTMRHSPPVHRRPKSSSPRSQHDEDEMVHYTSFPSPSKIEARTRNDSIHSSSSKTSSNRRDNRSPRSSTSSASSNRPRRSSNQDSHPLEAICARYTEAPPPYPARAYEGKDEDERYRMRVADYAKELSRLMGRQLVRVMKTGEEGEKA